MQILNLDLLKEPYNWAAVVIMALFGLMLLAVVSPEGN